MAFVAELTGNVATEPKVTEFDDGGKIKSFRVAVNERRKNRDTGEYEDTGNVTWVGISLRGDLADEDVYKGDLVEVNASLRTRDFQGSDGTTRQSLETTFINSFSVKYPSKNRPGKSAASNDDELPW